MTTHFFSTSCEWAFSLRAGSCSRRTFPSARLRARRMHVRTTTSLYPLHPPAPVLSRVVLTSDRTLCRHLCGQLFQSAHLRSTLRANGTSHSARRGCCREELRPPSKNLLVPSQKLLWLRNGRHLKFGSFFFVFYDPHTVVRQCCRARVAPATRWRTKNTLTLSWATTPPQPRVRARGSAPVLYCDQATVRHVGMVNCNSWRNFRSCGA